MQQLEQTYADSQASGDQTYQASSIDEANPWLRRTQWAAYLKITPQGLPHLLASIETPDETREGPEGAVRAIWEAMASVARISQRITKQTGHLIRIEAVRTEKDQSPHQPLQAYMDEEQIQRHVEPWQQVLMFFARTQVDHEWPSPPYRFTARQQRTWQALWRLAQDIRGSPDPIETETQGDRTGDRTDDQYQMTPIQVACMDFCIELLNDRIRAEEYECALICALAVLGRGRDRWRDAESYPPILSKMIKISRFMVLHKALRLDPHAEQILDYMRDRQEVQAWAIESPMEDADYIYAGQDEGYDSESVRSTPTPASSPASSPAFEPVHPPPEPMQFSQQQRRKPRPFREWLRFLTDTFMVRGTHSPMQWMLDLRTYGLRIHYNSTATGHVSWLGQDELLYKEIHFTMGDFRGFVHGLVSSMRQLMHEELLMCEAASTPAIPWDQVMDDPTQPKPGWSFLDDSRTPWPLQGAQWLMNRIQREPRLQQQFIDGPERRFRIRAIERYMQSVVHFREKLAVGVHVTAGQPGRAPELLSIRHRNTQGAHRNIFVEDGLVVFATKYHKGFYASNDAKIIHRYLPRAVGELVVWYLWLVLPFVERLQALQQHMQGISRETVQGIQSRAAYIWGPDPHDGREWTSERLREALKRETEIGLKGRVLNLPAYRNIAIGISRRYLRLSSSFPENVRNDGSTEAPAEDEDHERGMDHDQFMGHIADLQAAHSSHVAGMIYGREITEQAGTTAHRREMFRLSSTDWHRFLGFESAEEPLGRVLGKRKAGPWESEADERRQQRHWQLQQTNMTEALQRLTDDDQCQFRGVQAPAIQAIQHGISPVVAVMPTGGGKSMLFMLPAYVGGGLTVVVVPLVALRGDVQRRCAQAGISCVQWESRRPPDEAAIVLVTPESALSEDFITFLNRQQVCPAPVRREIPRLPPEDARPS